MSIESRRWGDSAVCGGRVRVSALCVSHHHQHRTMETVTVNNEDTFYPLTGVFSSHQPATIDNESILHLLHDFLQRLYHYHFLNFMHILVHTPSKFAESDFKLDFLKTV